MKAFVAAAVLIAPFLQSSPAMAGQLTVRELAGMCSSKSEGEQRGCNLYILGAFEGLGTGGNVETRNGKFVQKTANRQFCVPEDLPNAVMRDKVLEMLNMDMRSYPDDASLPAISWISAVVAKAWPCS